MGIATPSLPQIAEENQDIELGCGSRVGRAGGTRGQKDEAAGRRPRTGLFRIGAPLARGAVDQQGAHQHRRP